MLLMKVICMNECMSCVCVPAFKMYTYALAEAGEVDSLLVIRQQNLPNTLDHFVHQRIFNAYVKA